MVITAAVLEGEIASMRPWMGEIVRTLADRFREVDAERAGRARQPLRTPVEIKLPI